jgi:hypothetical protein
MKKPTLKESTKGYIEYWATRGAVRRVLPCKSEMEMGQMVIYDQGGYRLAFIQDPLYECWTISHKKGESL